MTAESYPDPVPESGPEKVAVASITATECHGWHKTPISEHPLPSSLRQFSPLYASLALFFKTYGEGPSVLLPGGLVDWISFVHIYPEQQPAINGGQVFAIDPDGAVVYHISKGQLLQGSFDTRLMIKCDGDRLTVAGNIGRFGEPDNVQGLPFSACWAKVLRVLSAHGVSVEGLGELRRVRNADGSVSRVGTHLTRVDVTCNVRVSDYDLACQAYQVCAIFGLSPVRGRYGVMWGYDRKRGNWLKFKFYDKSKESGVQCPESGTVGRFEGQLGSAWLSRYGLDDVRVWLRDDDMGDLILGRFAGELRTGASATEWGDMPKHLCWHLATWREGRNLRNALAPRTYYRVRKELLAYGIDISQPCNILAFTPRIRELTVQWLPSRRQA